MNRRSVFARCTMALTAANADFQKAMAANAGFFTVDGAGIYTLVK